jgi:rod shape-determining protein MreD
MSYLSPLLAVVAGIVHAGLAPVIIIGGVKPNLVLVAVVLVTCLFGFVPGLVWAFVAGLTANLLVGEPLGAVPLSLLVVAAAVAGGGRLLGGFSPAYAIAAAFVGSVLADVGSLVLSQLVGSDAAGPFPFAVVVTAAALNAAIVAVAVIPARAIALRYAPRDMPAW